MATCQNHQYAPCL